jgi:hypothetical protein
MGARLYRHGALSLAAVACTAIGCVSSPAPLTLTSLEPTADQRKIAEYYRQEALSFRLKARELAERIAAYQDLFGADSDWVNGARLLAQFYEHSAIDQDHQALMHLSIADDTRTESFDRRSSPRHNSQMK